MFVRRSLVLRQRLKESIKTDIAQRTQVHQSRIAALKAARARLLAENAPAAIKPLVMLAHGDSWFNYPLNGNDLSLENTDVIAQLESMGNVNPSIQNVSHYADATSEEMS